MKRMLVLAAVAAAAVLAPAPAAQASHLCVTSGGNPVFCVPHLEDQFTIEWPEKLCVKAGSRDLVCVF